MAVVHKEQNLQTEDILNTQILTNLKTKKKKKWRQNKDTIHLKARYLIHIHTAKLYILQKTSRVHGVRPCPVRHTSFY